ncbi:MAG: NADH-ubiquinone oxidoreductase-F iron-sulfur binding region domain-containing protein, partial [Thermodesulfobacteriota bacterium]|nr:NADH-ubiquinone oxidoreductase-F iron-sulfur binding region domain-containing protein [Thermodesulfobacteriota bacterium]
KWEAGRNAPGEEKYVVCNADEGDPGAFMDRSLIEGDPHALLEGMIIAGYTIGAVKGYIYVRAEYPLAIKRLQIAIAQANEKGFLGTNILGKGFGFDLEIFQGAGAFVCGESTALTLSIEGKRGMPKAAPRPQTTEKGIFDKPTLLNNVKTFASVPLIITRGGDWFASVGTEKSKGTAVFALTGKVENCGLIEVPMGITLREIVYDVGGGIPLDKKFKAVQTGGPSGGCLPASLLDTPVDYDSLKAAGAIMGSGGMVIMDEETCMVDVARYFLDFTQKESCGQCVPCSLGTKQMLDILKDITQGKGRPTDVDLLIEIAEAVKDGSLCGLGKSAPNPVLTTIRYFRDEYEAHINEKQCPALACNDLIHYEILPNRCTACHRCLWACPSMAISGHSLNVPVINQTKCSKCGICSEVCPACISPVLKLPGVQNATPQEPQAGVKEVTING